MNIKAYALLAFTFISLNLYGNTQKDFDEFIKGYASIKSIKGSIIQYIYNGNIVEKMHGDYSAVSRGLFRIDYFYPEKQSVINNSNGLYWYYPDREIVFVKPVDRNDPGMVSYLPGNSCAAGIDGVNAVYEGIRFYGLFKYAHVYSFSSRSDGNIVNIWFEPERRYVIRKYITDRTGTELVKEVYHEHFISDGIYIPSTIELFIRSNNGVIHMRTEYKNLCINTPINKKLFEFSIKKNVTVRRLNEYQR